MFSQWEFETSPRETTALYSPGAPRHVKSAVTIALNTPDSLITTEHSVCKTHRQTSCIFVPSIPGMLFVPQNVMYTQEVMSLQRGTPPPPNIIQASNLGSRKAGLAFFCSGTRRSHQDQEHQSPGPVLSPAAGEVFLLELVPPPMAPRAILPSFPWDSCLKIPREVYGKRWQRMKPGDF